MAHLICCPRQRDREVVSPDPPSRPRMEMDGMLDSVLAQGILPEDHPHGRRFHLSPVDFKILRSPKIGDKIRLKMGRKSSRRLRKQLSQIIDGPYNPDAHAITSNLVLGATATPEPHDETSWENGQNQAQTLTLTRFGTRSASDDPSQVPRSRPVLYSPSVYSRSASRVNGDKSLRPGTSPSVIRLMRPNSDFFGLAYRMILPRKPSASTTVGDNRHSRHDSRHLSASTDSTVTRRLEESHAIGCAEAHDEFGDHAWYDGQAETSKDCPGDMATPVKQKQVPEHQQQISEHRERV